jgi:tetratricopeptide (TPR) repeat protein
MEASRLKLVRSGDRGGTRSSRVAPLCLGALTIAAALLATALGADRARRAFDPVETGQRIFVRLLEHGSQDSEVREGLIEVRRRVGDRPLDATTRALYAELLLDLSGGKDTSAACFYASRAADLNPVTVPVVRYAAHVLLRCGERTEALRLTHNMFGYDPESAARLLLSLEPFLQTPISPASASAMIPDDPDAWVAWVREISGAGRGEEAEAWLRAGKARWPRHAQTMKMLATRAAQRRDWGGLAEILPLNENLPVSPEWAVLHALRGRLRAETGDVDGAVRDVEQALELSRGPSVAVAAGDVMAAAGRAEEARQLWHRILFDLRNGNALRLALLARLARLEDAQGTPASALRAWRAVLEEDPDHAEAIRRIEALTGFAP